MGRSCHGHNLVGGAGPCLDFALQLGMDIAALGGGGLEATAGRSGWPATTAESAGTSAGVGVGSASLGPSPGSLAASTLSFSVVILGHIGLLRVRNTWTKHQ